MHKFMLNDGVVVTVELAVDKSVSVRFGDGPTLTLTEATRDGRLLGLWARVVKSASFHELRSYTERVRSACMQAVERQLAREGNTVRRYWPVGA